MQGVLLTLSLFVNGCRSGWEHGLLEPVDPEIFMNATTLITSKGFPCENHYVTTEDGFILNMQRIPHERKERAFQAGKPAVLLQHGLLGSSTNFLDNLVNESLAYILADAGADVWLGNIRGNHYSRAHKTLNPSDRKFWEWSFDEMAKYDLPAMIDYILQTTGQSQLTYVGHSQGTMMGFSGFSQNKTLGQKVKTFVALAPVAKMGHVKGPFAKLPLLARDFKPLLDVVGHGEFLPTTEMTTKFATGFCDNKPAVCENIFFVLGGTNLKGLNQYNQIYDYDASIVQFTPCPHQSRVPVYIAHNPAGTSVQNMIHFAQDVGTDRFQMFDYGSPEKNSKHYGQPTPPVYHLEKMEVPVVLYRGGNDYLADPTDVSWLQSVLTSVRADHYIPEWEHLDFIWALDAVEKCYKDIVNLVFN